jgi:hypothetical protein
LKKKETEEIGERKRRAKRNDMSSDKRALRLGPAIRTKASSVTSLREAPRSSRRGCRDACHKDQLKASAAIDENPKKNRSTSNWERNGDGLKKLESLCSSLNAVKRTVLPQNL